MWSHPIRNMVQKFLYTIKDPEIIIDLFIQCSIYIVIKNMNTKYVNNCLRLILFDNKITSLQIQQNNENPFGKYINY